MRDIFKEIVSYVNISTAWHEFRRGKHDRTDVMAFERHLEDNIFSLHSDLVSGTYRHGAYHRFHIFDPKHRIIHKASVRDRLVHRAVYRILLPVFERSFIFDSYSCRECKGTHAAVRRLEAFAREVSKNFRDPCWVLKFDIHRFFDSVDHETLLGILERGLQKDPLLAFGMTEEAEKTMRLLSEIVGSYSAHASVVGGGLKRASEKRAPHREPDESTLRQCVHGRT